MTDPTGFPVGRESDYSKEMGNFICDLLASGLSLSQVCRREDIPNRTTVCRWIRDFPQFAEDCARIKEGPQADFVFDELSDIENDTLSGKITPDVARTVISSKQWRASRMAPRKYGDRARVEMSGPDGRPLQVVGALFTDPVEAARVYQAMLENGEE